MKERMSPNAFSHRTWISYDCHTLLSLDSIIAASAEIAFFHIAILSQMQLILQPYGAPQHKWLPTAPGVCVCSLLCVCTLDGLNVEHKFRVWVTILGCMSRHFALHLSICPFVDLP